MEISATMCFLIDSNKWDGHFAKNREKVSGRARKEIQDKMV